MARRSDVRDAWAARRAPRWPGSRRRGRASGAALERRALALYGASLRRGARPPGARWRAPRAGRGRRLGAWQRAGTLGRRRSCRTPRRRRARDRVRRRLADWTPALLRRGGPRGRAVRRHGRRPGRPAWCARRGGPRAADRCNHRGGPLHRGSLQDGCVTCPWHASRFRLEDGSVDRGPRGSPQPTLRRARGRATASRSGRPRRGRPDPAALSPRRPRPRRAGPPAPRAGARLTAARCPRAAGAGAGCAARAAAARPRRQRLQVGHVLAHDRLRARAVERGAVARHHPVGPLDVRRQARQRREVGAAAAVLLQPGDLDRRAGSRRRRAPGPTASRSPCRPGCDRRLGAARARRRRSPACRARAAPGRCPATAAAGARRSSRRRTRAASAGRRPARRAAARGRLGDAQRGVGERDAGQHVVPVAVRAQQAAQRPPRLAQDRRQRVKLVLEDRRVDHERLLAAVDDRAVVCHISLRTTTTSPWTLTACIAKR